MTYWVLISSDTLVCVKVIELFRISLQLLLLVLGQHSLSQILGICLRVEEAGIELAFTPHIEVNLQRRLQ